MWCSEASSSCKASLPPSSPYESAHFNASRVSRAIVDASSVETHSNPSSLAMTDSSDLSPCSSSGGFGGGASCVIGRVGSPHYPFTRPTSPCASAASERQKLQRQFRLPEGSITRQAVQEEVLLFSEDFSPSSSGCSPACGAGGGASTFGSLGFQPLPTGDSPSSVGGGSVLRRLTLELGGQSPQGVGGGERLARLSRGAAASAHAVYTARLQMAVLRSSQPSLSLTQNNTSSGSGPNGEQLLSSIAAAEDGGGPLMRPPAEFGSVSLGALSLEGLVSADEASTSSGDSAPSVASDLWRSVGEGPPSLSFHHHQETHRPQTSTPTSRPGDVEAFEAPASGASSLCLGFEAKGGISANAALQQQENKVCRLSGGRVGELAGGDLAAASPSATDPSVHPRLLASCCASNGDKELAGGGGAISASSTGTSHGGGGASGERPQEVHETARPSPTPDEAPFDLLLPLTNQQEAASSNGDCLSPPGVSRPPPPSTFQVTDDSVCFLSRKDVHALCVAGAPEASGPSLPPTASSSSAEASASSLFSCVGHPPSARLLPCFASVPVSSGPSVKTCGSEGGIAETLSSSTQYFFPVAEDPTLNGHNHSQGSNLNSSKTSACVGTGQRPPSPLLSCSSPTHGGAGQVSSNGCEETAGVSIVSDLQRRVSAMRGPSGPASTVGPFSSVPPHSESPPPLYLGPQQTTVETQSPSVVNAGMFASAAPTASPETSPHVMGPSCCSDGEFPSLKVPTSTPVSSASSDLSQQNAGSTAPASTPLSPMLNSEALFQHPTPAFIDYCIKKHLPSNPNPDNLPGIQLERQQKRWCASVYFRGNQFKKRFSSGRWGVLGAFYAAIEWRQVQCRKFQKLRNVCGGGIEETLASSSSTGGRNEGVEVSNCGATTQEEGLASRPAASGPTAGPDDRRQTPASQSGEALCLNSRSTGTSSATKKRRRTATVASGGSGIISSKTQEASHQLSTDLTSAATASAQAMKRGAASIPPSSNLDEEAPSHGASLDAAPLAASGRNSRRRTTVSNSASQTALSANSSSSGGTRCGGESSAGRRGTACTSSFKARVMKPPPLLAPSPSSSDKPCVSPGTCTSEGPCPLERGISGLNASSPVDVSSEAAVGSTVFSQQPPPFAGIGGAVVGQPPPVLSPLELAGTPRGPSLQQLGLEAEFELSNGAAARATAVAVQNWNGMEGTSEVGGLWKGRTTSSSTSLSCKTSQLQEALGAVPSVSPNSDLHSLLASEPPSSRMPSGGGVRALRPSAVRTPQAVEGDASAGGKSHQSQKPHCEANGSLCCSVSRGGRRPCSGTEEATSDGEVDRLFDGEEVKWFEGFRLPFGTEGRNQLLRRLRQLYHSNAAYWSAQLEQQRITFSRVPFATVPELWKIAHIMGCFRFALHLSHKYAGGGSGRHSSSVSLSSLAPQTGSAAATSKGAEGAGGGGVSGPNPPTTTATGGTLIKKSPRKAQRLSGAVAGSQASSSSRQSRSARARVSSSNGVGRQATAAKADFRERNFIADGEKLQSQEDFSAQTGHAVSLPTSSDGWTSAS